MQRKGDRTLIPRSSPPKSNFKATTTPYSPTPHHNGPIPLRGTGKPALSLKPSYRAVDDRPPLSLPARPSQATRPISITPQIQRTNGSRIPGPLTFQGQGCANLGLGFAFPTSTSVPKVAPAQTSPQRTGRPSFHVPVIHSPAFRTAPTVQHARTDAGINSRDNGGPVESVKPTMPSRSPGAGERMHDAFPEGAPGLVRIPTAASNMSSESQYTNQSAAEYVEHLSPRNLAMDGIDEDKDADGKGTSETELNGVDCEDEDVVLSPGFDVIQALANTPGEKSIDPNIPSEHVLTTPRPFPFSRDKPSLRQPVLPLSPPASVVTHTSPSSPSIRTPKTYRHSLLSDAANLASNNALDSSPPHSQMSKSKTPPPHQQPPTPGNIPDIITEIEALVGHPCMDRDAIDAAYCEARAEPDKPTCKLLQNRLYISFVALNDFRCRCLIRRFCVWCQTQRNYTLCFL
jgi:hypothetical protein